MDDEVDCSAPAMQWDTNSGAFLYYLSPGDAMAVKEALDVEYRPSSLWRFEARHAEMYVANPDVLAKWSDPFSLEARKDKTQVEWTPELRFVQGLLQRVMTLVTGFCSVSYLVLDGHFGNNNALQMVLQATSLHLVSKLRNNAAL